MKKYIRLLTLTTIAVCLIISIMSFVFHTNRVKGAMNDPIKTYKSIYINKNDTLWDIASQHMNPNYYDYNTYIEEVVNINNINNSTIYAGDTIIIPIVTSSNN